MTKQLMFPGKQTALSDFIRKKCRDSNDGLTANNLDYVMRRYDEWKLMLIEEKTRGALLSTSQKLTFSVLDTALRAYCKPPVLWTYLGFFLVQMSGESPEDSEWIRINGVSVSKQQLSEHISCEAIHAPPMGDGASWNDFTRTFRTL